jgi:hypothetical protein
MIPKMAELFRLVKYYNLPRYMYTYIHRHPEVDRIFDVQMLVRMLLTVPSSTPG